MLACNCPTGNAGCRARRRSVPNKHGAPARGEVQLSSVSMAITKNATCAEALIRRLRCANRRRQKMEAVSLTKKN